MALTHVPESEALHDFAGVLARVQAGEDILIERGSVPVEVVRAPTPLPRTIEECIALLPETSEASLDGDFESDLEAVLLLRREPLSPPDWT